MKLRTILNVSREVTDLCGLICGANKASVDVDFFQKTTKMSVTESENRNILAHLP